MNTSKLFGHPDKTNGVACNRLYVAHLRGIDPPAMPYSRLQERLYNLSLPATETSRVMRRPGKPSKT